MNDNAATQRDKLLSALIKLHKAAPKLLNCEVFHHRKKDRHAHGEDCPCEDRYDEAIYNAESLIKEMKK